MLILPPGHARDVARSRRLTSRERWLVRNATALTVALVVVIVLALASGSNEPRKGCIDVAFASATGGSAVKACGAAARATCAAVDTPKGYSGSVGQQVAERCRQLRLPIGR